VRGAGNEVLARRPAPKSWAATEVICHLRDNEEWFLERMKLVVAMDQPRFVATNPDRWAEERQYLTNDATVALAAFTRRREETLGAGAEQGPVVQGDPRLVQEEGERVGAGRPGVSAVEPGEIGRLGRRDPHAGQARARVVDGEVAVGLEIAQELVEPRLAVAVDGVGRGVAQPVHRRPE